MTESRFMFRRIVRVAFARFVSLGADESGVALAVTILMFSLLFLSFASVYAIGTVTREKIHLQNAADAAAYSAAVVQADTLSRLATINRAMAWTYVQQTRREMDYIVYRWLELALSKYMPDWEEAEDWNDKGNCPEHRSYPTWYIGTDMIPFMIDLNGTKRPLALFVREKLLEFSAVHLPKQEKSYDLSLASLTGVGGLGTQIDFDRAAIAAMNAAEYDLSRQMKRRMRDAAEDALHANIPADLKSGTFISYHHDDTMLGNSGIDGPASYLRIAENTREDERQFCGCVGTYADSDYPDRIFETGIDAWFVRPDSDTGIMREYRQLSSALYAEWDWYSFFCIYIPWPADEHIFVPDMKEGVFWHSRRVEGKDPSHNYYKTARAQPRFLKKDYFGEDGTVSVGVARWTDEGENVWSRITGTAQGLFAAFNPSVRWTWAFSSAKAGYHRPSDSDRDSRAYDISWRGDSQGHGFETVGGERKYWNLCETDWDAVFLPVRKTKTLAEAGVWKDGSTDFMQDWVTDAWTPLGGGSAGSDMASVPAPPEVGGERSNLDWGRITDVMYH